MVHGNGLREHPQFEFRIMVRGSDPERPQKPLLWQVIAAGFEVHCRSPSGEQQRRFPRAVSDGWQQPMDDVGDARHALCSERRVRHRRYGFLDPPAWR